MKINDTPLHLAAKENQEDISILLLSYGASLKIKNLRKEDPLDLASESLKVELLKADCINSIHLNGVPEKKISSAQRIVISIVLILFFTFIIRFFRKRFSSQ